MEAWFSAERASRTEIKLFFQNLFVQHLCYLAFVLLGTRSNYRLVVFLSIPLVIFKDIELKIVVAEFSELFLLKIRTA